MASIGNWLKEYLPVVVATAGLIWFIIDLRISPIEQDVASMKNDISEMKSILLRVEARQESQQYIVTDLGKRLSNHEQHHIATKTKE